MPRRTQQTPPSQASPRLLSLALAADAARVGLAGRRRRGLPRGIGIVKTSRPVDANR